VAQQPNTGGALVEYVGFALVIGGVLVTVYGFVTRREQGWSLMWLGASVTANMMTIVLGDRAQPLRIGCLIAAFAFLTASFAAMVHRRRAQRRAS
jgi:uncharacterized membrane protein HdeD (DUF308 family)